MPQESPTPTQVLNGLRELFFARVPLVEVERNQAINSWEFLEKALCITPDSAVPPRTAEFSG